jgi:hypothetical protein
MPSSPAAPTAFCPAFAKPILKLAIFSALLVAAMTTIPNLQAQQPAEPPAAPVPSQILNAKRVFIANATGDHDLRIAKYMGGPDGIYNQFYADVKSGGRFELVSAPADADLVLYVTLGIFPLNPGYAGFRLSIIDPKTSILLWTMSEPIDPAFLAKTARKNMVASLDRLAGDLKTLTPGK